MKATASLLFLSGVLLVFAVASPGDGPLLTMATDAELNASVGRDDNSDPYDSNCAYVNLDPGEVAWRDCNGQPDQTACVICDGGDVDSRIDGSEPENVQVLNLKRCGIPGFTKRVGKCIGGQCVDMQDSGDDCSGEMTNYEPQPTSWEPPA